LSKAAAAQAMLVISKVAINFFRVAVPV